MAQARGHLTASVWGGACGLSELIVAAAGRSSASWAASLFEICYDNFAFERMWRAIASRGEGWHREVRIIKRMEQERQKPKSKKEQIKKQKWRKEQNEKMTVSRGRPTHQEN